VKKAGVILQIVPRAPGGRDGVGDYAWTLALGLQRINGCKTTFVSAAPSGTVKTEKRFDILSPLTAISDQQWRQYAEVPIVLHYVNYGYQRRGVPLWLPKRLRQLRRSRGRRVITIFHELYASGSWCQSAFWLRPMQMRITRALARLSDLSIVSSEVLRAQLHCLAPGIPILVRPVFSNFGEPVLSPAQLGARDPHRWVICGGTDLVERSVRSILRRKHLISGPSAPQELFVLGGAERSAIRKALENDKEIVAQCLPNVDKAIASGILASCAFGWIDYFRQLDTPTAAILKSGSYAALCAHGVIPVLPHTGSMIALRDDALPGPFFVAASAENLPTESERPNVARAVYAWYGRNASSVHLAQSIAEALGK
jgi:hypothetical protein